MTFLADITNEWPLILWIATNFRFFALRSKTYWKKTKTKENANTLVDYLCGSINALFKLSMFPSCLKLTDVTPLHKKGMEELKEDSRSVSIRPTLSKMFDRIMFVQISASFDNVFSKYQCRFREGYCTQHCNLKILEKWKNVSAKEKISVLYQQTSQRHCLDHKLLTCKLNAYSLNIPALRLIHDYLSNRKQRTKIENIWILFGVTQVSILRPLLFNIFLADLFFIISNIDIASYADENSWYCCW